jgi:hypothetical protein
MKCSGCIIGHNEYNTLLPRQLHDDTYTANASNNSRLKLVSTSTATIIIPTLFLPSVKVIIAVIVFPIIFLF